MGSSQWGHRARAEAAGEQVTVRAPAFADVAGVALGALVDGLGAWASLGW